MNEIKNNLIKDKLKPLKEFMQMKNLVELWVSRPGEVELSLEGQEKQYRQNPDLTYEYWVSLCRLLSKVAGAKFDPHTLPFVSVSLPGGHRFTATLQEENKPNLSIAISIKRSLQFTMHDFEVPGFLQKEIITAVEEGESIIVSGPPNSGKTEFLNILLRCVPSSKSIYTLEDVEEVEVSQPRHVSLIANRFKENVSSYLGSLVNHIGAVKPDYIILNEIMHYNSPFLLQILENEPSFMATINSSSCKETLKRSIPLKVTQSFSGSKAEEVSEFLEDRIDWVIYLQKSKKDDNFKRKVVEVWRPKTKYYWKSENI